MSKTNYERVGTTPSYIKDSNKREDTNNRFKSMYHSACLDLMLTEDEASKYPLDSVVECYLIKDMLDEELDYTVTDSKKLLRVVGNTYIDITTEKLKQIKKELNND